MCSFILRCFGGDILRGLCVFVLGGVFGLTWRDYIFIFLAAILLLNRYRFIWRFIYRNLDLLARRRGLIIIFGSGKEVEWLGMRLIRGGFLFSF